MFDYDLLILGASAGGLEAAIVALQERSRVAVLTLGLPLDLETIAHLDGLRQAGVDVVEERGYFRGQGVQTLERSRILRARTYVMALPAVPRVPDLTGLTTIPYDTSLTVDPTVDPTIDPVATSPTAERWLIVGDGWEGLQDAHRLITQGQSVTLLRHNPITSPLVQRIQVYLEGLGVKIFRQIHCTAVERDGAEIRVCTQKGDWWADRLLVAGGWQPAPVEGGLHLQALHPQLSLPLGVNRYLQSQVVPHLYGCGISLGGSPSPALARYEARVAVLNALYFPRKPIRYDWVPYTVMTTPIVTQVGWTFESASQHWPRSALMVLECSGFWDGTGSDRSLLRSSIQVLLHCNGRILGAQGIGERSAQAVQVVGLARRRGLTWLQLLRSLPGGEVADLFFSLQCGWVAENPKGRWRESFFNWRRTGYL